MLSRKMYQPPAHFTFDQDEEVFEDVDDNLVRSNHETQKAHFEMLVKNLREKKTRSKRWKEISTDLNEGSYAVGIRKSKDFGAIAVRNFECYVTPLPKPDTGQHYLFSDAKINEKPNDECENKHTNTSNRTLRRLSASIENDVEFQEFYTDPESATGEINCRIGIFNLTLLDDETQTSDENDKLQADVHDIAEKMTEKYNINASISFLRDEFDRFVDILKSKTIRYITISESMSHLFRIHNLHMNIEKQSGTKIEFLPQKIIFSGPDTKVDSAVTMFLEQFLNLVVCDQVVMTKDLLFLMEDESTYYFTISEFENRDLKASYEVVNDTLVVYALCEHELQEAVKVVVLGSKKLKTAV